MVIEAVVKKRTVKSKGRTYVYGQVTDLPQDLIGKKVYILNEYEYELLVKQREQKTPADTIPVKIRDILKLAELAVGVTT